MERKSQIWNRRLLKKAIKLAGTYKEETDTLFIPNVHSHVFDSSNGKTANRYKREIKSLFNFLQKRHLIDNDPTSPLEDYEEEVFKKYVPPAEDIQAVLDIANEFESDIIRTAYHTAARSGEIRHIAHEDVDLKNNALTLWTRKRKNGNKPKRKTAL